MSSDDESGRISHHGPSLGPLTPPISARWEDETGTEQLNHLYALLKSGEWGREAEIQLARLDNQVREGKRLDVTKEQLDQLRNMSSDYQSRRISHRAPSHRRLTPPISARWEDKTGTEQLNHLYALFVNGEWGREPENQLAHLDNQVREGKRLDVTKERLDQLRRKVWQREWSFQTEKLTDTLYRKVMNGEWDDVIKIYKEQKEMIQMARITPSEQTALHIGISNSLTDMVERLLKNIDALEIREMTDNRKENPLHLAASLGQFETCKLLVERDPELIGARNVEGETPLFLAVLYGKKEAFYALHPKCPITGKDIKHAKAHCKRNDGNTILHVSIRGEYFQLAYQIIHWYPELINDVNKDEKTALHLLAENPSSFRSGCDLGSVDYVIYSCLIVDSDKVGTPSDFTGKHCADIACRVPPNYQTCMDLLNLGKRVLNRIVSWARAWKDIKSDVCKIFSRNVDRLPVKSTIERQETSNKDEMSHDCQRDHINIKGDKTKPQMGPRIEERSGDSTPEERRQIRRTSQMENKDSTERPQYPSNYHVFLLFLQFAIQLFLPVISLGYFQFGKIKDQKRKHRLTDQIMKRLVNDTGSWVYDATGSRPDLRGVKERIPPPSNAPDDDSTEGIIPDQDASASTSKNPPGPDGSEEEKKWKEIMERIIPGIQAEKTRSDVYRFKMQKVSKDERAISPVLVAAKNGVVEIVEEILQKYSMAIYDVDADEKNAFMLAVENRQQDIYNILRKKDCHQSIIFQKLDKDKNSAIHLAASTGQIQPWPIAGAALKMQWELKWYEFVTETMPHNIFTTHRNNEGMTSKEAFAEAHKTMLKEGVKWLNNTAQSCSLVAALVATVAYAAATTVPGGVENGIPLLRNTNAFSIFTISSLVALCLSVTSLTMFLSILTSRNEISDFRHSLPMKLIMGLSSLFISIAAMLVSFCAGHFFDLADQLQHTAFPIYAVTCLPVSIYAVTQFPLYFDLIYSIIMPVPKRSN